jgi:chemotaxis protein histidine kinase CheA
VPRDLQQYFRTEARELIDALRQEIVRLKRVAASDEDRRPMMRLAYTLKGAATIAGYPDIAAAVQRLEATLGASRFDGTIDPGAIEMLKELEQVLTDLEIAAAPSDVTRRVREAAAARDAAGREALDRLLVEIAQARGGLRLLRAVPLERINVSASPASVFALEVASGAARALVPLDSVRTVVRLAGAGVSAGPGGATLRFERGIAPLVSLRLAAGLSTEVRSSFEPEADADEDRFAVIVDAAAGPVALGVRGPGRVVTVPESGRDQLVSTIKALLAVPLPPPRQP